jgi:hypothetical protein
MAESLRCDDIDAMGARRGHKLAEYSTVEVLPNQAFPYVGLMPSCGTWAC